MKKEKLGEAQMFFRSLQEGFENYYKDLEKFTNEKKAR